MTKILRTTFYFLSIVIIVCQLCYTNSANADIKLSFGVYTTDKPTVIVKELRPVLRLLERSVSKALDEPVSIKLQIARSYTVGINDIITGKVDFSRLGPASYIESKRQQPNLQIIAIESIDGEKSFNGVVAVSADSPITEATQLKGTRFAFGDEASTIGRYLAQQYLFNEGVRASDLAHYDYLGRHDKVGTAVALGQYDAGALKESTYNRLLARGARLRVLATFPNVSKPWIAREGLDSKIILALKEALLAMKDPEALKALHKDGFIDGNDGDYAVIRQAIEQNSWFFN
jgi:phosphonate transport system substrate-binding protein